jgi:uncharacterized protein
VSAPIVHIEFKSANFARTSAFYAQVFDWQIQQNASASYMKLDGSDGPSGGWVRADLVQAPGPVAYLVVEDLASKLDEIEKAGGRILVRSLPFAGGGEVALFADPDGNVLGLWKRKGGGAAAESAPAPAATTTTATTTTTTTTAVAKPAGKTAKAPAAKPPAKPRKKKA